VPLASFGILTFVGVLHAARVMRSRLVWWSAIAFSAIDVGFVLDSNHASDTTALTFVGVSWAGGTVYLVVLADRYRRSAFGARAVPAVPVVPPVPDRSQQALDNARRVRQRRAEARAIVAEDPALAVELWIGRPDVEHDYDDGRLIDVNHVPATWLVYELDMTAELADELVELRGIRGGFSSADDMLVACDSLNPERLDAIRERLIFLPRDIDPDSAWLPPPRNSQ
jgi:hypothetical protein